MKISPCYHSPFIKAAKPLTGNQKFGITLIALGVLVALVGALAMFGASNSSSKLALLGKVTKVGAAGMVLGGALLTGVGIYFINKAPAPAVGKLAKAMPQENKGVKLFAQPEPVAEGAEDKPAEVLIATPAKPKSPKKPTENTAIKLRNELSLSKECSEPLDYLSGLISPKRFFEETYKGDTEVAKANRLVGNELEGQFYLMRARGGGDCFYLSYAASLLFLVAENPDEASRLHSHSVFKEVKETEPLKRALAAALSPVDLKALLEDKVKMQEVVNALRVFACALVKANMTDFEVDLYESSLQPGADYKGIKTVEAYLNKAKNSAECAQQLEIGLLDEKFVPICFCDSKEEAGAGKPGLRNKLPFAVHLLTRPNHFDALIPAAFF
jgi:hypothetical protein